MRWLGTIFLFCFSLSSSFSQESSSIVLVKPGYTPESKAVFRSMAEYFELYMPGAGLEKIYSMMARDALELNGFFVAVGSEKYVLTLAEPIRPVRQVRLSWTLSNGTVITDENAFPVFYDDEAGISLISPSLTDLPPALLLTDTLPQDGGDVWSIGYQNLLGQPKLETLRGNVSNNRLFLSEGAADRQTTYIQHTITGSEISSGSPLFPGTPGRLVPVVGMNVSLPIQRSNTAFSVPGVALIGALNRFQTYDRADKIVDVILERNRVLNNFLNAPSWNENAYHAFLPPDQLIDKGWEVLRGILSGSNRNVVREWLGRMSRRPVAVLSQALSWNLYRESREWLPFVLSEPVTESGDSATGTLQFGGQNREISWKRRMADWYLAGLPNFRLDDAAAETEAGFFQWAGNYRNTGIGLEVGMGMAPSDQLEPGNHLVTGFHFLLPVARNAVFHLVLSITGSRFGINPGTRLAQYATGELFNPDIAAEAIPRVLDQLQIGIGPRLTLPFLAGGRYTALFLGLSGIFNLYSPHVIMQNGFTSGNLDEVWPFSSLGFFPEAGWEIEVDEHHILGIRGFKAYTFPLGTLEDSIQEQSLSFSVFYRYAF